jgi:hypothetical protein
VEWKYKEVLPYVVIRVWWVKTTACTKIQIQKKPEELMSKQKDQNLGKAATMIDDERDLRQSSIVITSMVSYKL